MNNAMQMACRAQFSSLISVVRDQSPAVSVKTSDKYIGIVSDTFSMGIDIGIDNTFCGEYRHRQYLFKVSLTTLKGTLHEINYSLDTVYSAIIINVNYITQIIYYFYNVQKQKFTDQ